MRAGAAPSTIAPFRRKAAPKVTYLWVCDDAECTITRRGDEAAGNHERKTGHHMSLEREA